MKKYEKVSIASEVIRKLIELGNSLPSKAGGPVLSWRAMMNKEFYELTGKQLFDLKEKILGHEDQKSFTQASRQADLIMNERTAQFPVFARFINDPELSNERYKELNASYRNIHPGIGNLSREKFIRLRYDELLQMYQQFRQIVEACQLKRDGSKYTSYDPDAVALGYEFLPFNVGLTLGTKIEFGFGEIFALRNVDPNRIGICPICEKIFWRRRLDASMCYEKRCSNNYNQRKRQIVKLNEKLAGKTKNYLNLINGLSAENNLTYEVAAVIRKLISRLQVLHLKNGVKKSDVDLLRSFKIDKLVTKPQSEFSEFQEKFIDFSDILEDLD